MLNVYMVPEFASPSPALELARCVLWFVADCIQGDFLDSSFVLGGVAREVAKRSKRAYERIDCQFTRHSGRPICLGMWPPKAASLTSGPSYAVVIGSTRARNRVARTDQGWEVPFEQDNVRSGGT